MPIVQNVLSFFSRKRPEKTDIDVTPLEPAADPVSTALQPQDNVIYIYSHGFTNGVYRIEPDKDSFERFLEYCNQVDRIKDLCALKEKAIAGIELKLNAAETAYAANTNTFIEKEKLADNVSLSLTELEQRRLKKDQKETALIAQAKETISEYSWIPAMLYFVAGITFIIADISITKQITSWGFGMVSGWQSWIFAIGLGFTAFLIKPMVDRLLEKPFQAGGFKLKTFYKGVLLLITGLGLLMLFLLGKFRSDSEIARNKLDELNAQMNTMDPNSPQYPALQAKIDAIQKSLDENFYGQYGLILSGMLFAIGSAVCLSIAFGAMKQLINRYWILPIRVGRVKREIKILNQQIAAIRSEHAAIKAELEKAETVLRTNEVPVLKEELEKLREERSILLGEFYQAQYEKERALYLDGKNKGDKYLIEGDLLYKVRGNDHSSLYLGKQDDKEEAQSSPSIRPYTRRPFVKMRKMIADNFNKNQNNQTYDGTEFEIVS